MPSPTSGPFVHYTLVVFVFVFVTFSTRHMSWEPWHTDWLPVYGAHLVVQCSLIGTRLPDQYLLYPSVTLGRFMSTGTPCKLGGQCGSVSDSGSGVLELQPGTGTARMLCRLSSAWRLRRVYVCRLGSRPALDIKRRAHEPRYSHHCYVRADDRHASAIGPILRIDQLPAGSYEFTGCGYGLGAVSVCQLPLHLGM